MIQDRQTDRHRNEQSDYYMYIVYPDHVTRGSG